MQKVREQVISTTILKTVLLIACLCVATLMLGQNSSVIEGRITEKENGEPVAFADVYNMSLKKGTISNTDGYFRIPVNGVNDSIRVRYIGFRDYFFRPRNSIGFYPVSLEEGSVLMGEVTILPDDNSYLFDLVQDCRKSASNNPAKAKAYYELKSYVGNTQVELVEGYYNIDIRGNKTDELNLKAGRLALRPSEDRFFTSIESSRAIIMLNLLSRNEYFPHNPLALSRPGLKKNFYLTLNNRYADGENDSVYVIGFQPRDTMGLAFGGELWVNKSRRHIMKITLQCGHARKHPFLPLFPTDKITGVSFNITQTFREMNNQAVFNHTDFFYEIGYVSRIGKSEEEAYSVRTNAVLYAYDYDHSFFLPVFDFNEYTVGDYRKINAMPFNEFFWANNDEYRLNDSLDYNKLFFEDSLSVTSRSVFQPNYYMERGLLEHPYIGWSSSRVKFLDMIPDTAQVNPQGGFASDQYKLAVRIFLDVNTYSDSTNILTTVIFDPYKSYYHLPVDSKTHCFVNLYFDLWEIYRREMETKLNAQRDDLVRVREIYDTFLPELESRSNEFLKAVQRGTNKAKMIKYNDLVRRELGIDNIGIFKPFDK